MSRALSHCFYLRSKSLALHAVRSRSFNSDTGEDGDEQSPDNIVSNAAAKPASEDQEAAVAERKVASSDSTPGLDRRVREAERGQSQEKDGEHGDQGESDRLLIHLRDNMETIREFCRDMMRHIPTPEQCVIEGNVHMTSLMEHRGNVSVPPPPFLILHTHAAVSNRLIIV